MKYLLSLLMCLALFSCSKPGVVGNWKFDSFIPLHPEEAGTAAAIIAVSEHSEGSTWLFGADNTLTVKDKSGKEQMTGKYDYNADEKILTLSSKDETHTFKTKVFKETLEMTEAIDGGVLTLKRIK